MPRPLNRDYTHWRSKIDGFWVLLPLVASLLLFLGGCSGIERAENEKIRRRNCKGDSSHPPLENQEQELSDCEGSSRHGLPVIHGQEGVYPILIELLNHIQERTGKKVVITCGHRCPVHNTYSDPSKENLVSKHQIGAEADFYVQGLEQQPLDIIELLMAYYKETPPYKGDPAFETFRRYERGDVRVSVKPWFNTEIFIQLFQPHEGRDGDNSHPYPYISIQVRYDRDLKEKVVYEWKKAHLGYPRG